MLTMTSVLDNRVSVRNVPIFQVLWWYSSRSRFIVSLPGCESVEKSGVKNRDSKMYLYCWRQTKLRGRMWPS